jgi:hypothetical protein
MSILLWLTTAFLVGGLVGAIAPIFVASFHDGTASFLIKTGIKSGDGWVLNQRANSYDLIAVEYDREDAKAYLADATDEYFEDEGGLMRSLYSTDFGISMEGTSAIVDAATAQVATEYSKLSADGGEVDADARFTLEELQNVANVGNIEKTESHQTNGGTVQLKSRIEYINPFTTVPDGRQIVDVRPVVNLLKNNGDSATPKTTAENAAQAERAFENWGELKRNASLIAAAMVGGILVYLGMSSGGGGGGGGGGGSVVPVMIDLAVGGVL